MVKACGRQSRACRCSRRLCCFSSLQSILGLSPSSCRLPSWYNCCCSPTYRTTLFLSCFTPMNALQTPLFVANEWLIMCRFLTFSATKIRKFLLRGESIVCELVQKWPLTRLFTVAFFCWVHMVMVSKNHGYKWFAVMVFTLSRLEYERFRTNSVCCGPVYCPWLSLRFGFGPVHDSRLSLRVGFGPVCTQHLSYRTVTSPMPSTLGMHSPFRTNSSLFLHPPSPQQPPLVVPIAHTEGIGCVFLAAQQ